MPESLWPAFSKEIFSFFSTKAYVVSTQINRLNEQQFKRKGKNYLQFYTQQFCI